MDALFGAASGVQVYDISDVGYIRMTINYVGLSILQSTIIPGNGFDTFNVTVTEDAIGVPAVPLPAGLPLLLSGLGAFGLIARRRKSV